MAPPDGERRGSRLALVVRRIAGPILAAALLLIASLFLMSSGFDKTDPLEVPPERVCGVRAPEPRVAPPGSIAVLTWNVAYGRGPGDDAGDLRDERTIRSNLEAIAGALERIDADVVALQEVDFDSARTHGIDEVTYLARAAGYPFAARVETWRCRYVPFPYWPPSQHYGRMRSGQAVLSRYPIRSNVRRLLPQPPNPFWYNAFYLHRAIQKVEIDMGGGTVVNVLNVHTEAFHQRNREEHARLLVERASPLRDFATIVLGDMNAIPPEAALRRAFPDEPETDMTTDSTIETIRSGLGFGEALDPSAYRDAPGTTFTFPADAPNRRLDYVFFSAGFRRAEGRVVSEAGPLSDHLPVLVRLEVVGAAGIAPPQAPR